MIFTMNQRLLILATCLLVCVQALVVAAETPNIVLIFADDLGHGDVRCFNDQSKVATAHIDRLAREGMRFMDALSPCTVCTPTRYSLMTGQMAFRVPNGGTVFTGVGGPSLIAPGRFTLPSARSCQRTPLRTPSACCPHGLMILTHRSAATSCNKPSVARARFRSVAAIGNSSTTPAPAANNPGLKPFHLPDTAPDAPGQLYNLATDPSETTNQYHARPEVVAELKALLEQSKSSGRSRPGQN